MRGQGVPKTPLSVGFLGHPIGNPNESPTFLKSSQRSPFFDPLSRVLFWTLLGPDWPLGGSWRPPGSSLEAPGSSRGLPGASWGLSGPCKIQNKVDSGRRVPVHCQPVDKLIKIRQKNWLASWLRQLAGSKSAALRASPACGRRPTRRFNPLLLPLSPLSPLLP